MHLTCLVSGTNEGETHGVQSSRSFIEHLIGKLKNFRFLRGRQHTQIASFELALDASIAVYNASALPDALGRLQARQAPWQNSRRHLKRTPSKPLRVGKSTPKKKRARLFADFHAWIAGRHYLAPGAESEALPNSAHEPLDSPCTRNQAPPVRLRPNCVKRARNSRRAGHFSWLEVSKLENSAGYLVCGHVAASYMDDRYECYAQLSEAGIEWKVCSCSQGGNACSHYGCLLEVLRELRDDSEGVNVQMKKRRSATPLEKLKKRPLSEVVGQNMVARLSTRIPVSPEPLHKPYERVFCICRAPRDVKTMLQCETCDEWYHRKCIGIHGDMSDEDIQKWVCGYCEAEEHIEDGEDRVSWLIQRHGRKNGKAKTFTRDLRDTPKRKLGLGISLGGNRGPRTKEECVARAKEEGARLFKKTKNYRESAEGMANRHSAEGTGHHTIDRARSGGGGTTRAPMTPALRQQLVEG